MDEIIEHLRDLWAERGRVFFVVLGVIWGTLSLTILLAFGNGFVSNTSQTARNFGPGLLRVRDGTTTMPHRGIPAGRHVNRVLEDVEIVRNVPGVEAVATECIMGSGNPLEYGDARMNVSVAGCSASFGDLRSHRPAAGGRFLNERDVDEHRAVIFLGDRIAERLFGDLDPVGRTVQLWAESFTVIGVRKSKITTSSYSGEDRDKVTIPVSTFRDLYGWSTISQLWVRFADPGAGPESRGAVADAVFEALAARHGIHPDDRDAIWMMDYVEIEDMIDLILDGNRAFMLVVGVIGLLVALVGVANVTYVMVEERTREIGVQIALGARPRDVATARFVESTLVTLVGGVIGISISAVILWGMNQIDLGPDVRGYFGFPQVSVSVSATVVALLMGGGSLAGWLPARRAAALDPVEALREE